MIDLLKEKTVLITGATNGIGLALAKMIAGGGANVLITGRDEIKLHRVRNQIIQSSGNQSVSSFVVDQRKLSDVEQLVDNLSGHKTIDILVNNAGVCPGSRHLNEQGLEQAFVVNYLSHVLLTHLLLDKLAAADQGRVVNVSSLAFGNGQLDFSNLQGERHFDGWQAYSNSKLFILLFNALLARQHVNSSVTSNAVCPGIVDTGLLVDNPLFTPERLASLKPAMQEPAKACELILYLMLEPSLKDLTGEFFSRGYGGFQPLPINLDEQMARELWSYSREMLLQLCPSSPALSEVIE